MKNKILEETRKTLSIFIREQYNGRYNKQFFTILSHCLVRWKVTNIYHVPESEIFAFNASLKSYWRHFNNGTSKIVAKPCWCEFAYMRKANKDIKARDGHVIIPHSRLITKTLLRRAEKHKVIIGPLMLQPLQSKPRSTHSEEKLLIDGVETTQGASNLLDATEVVPAETIDAVNHPKHYTSHPSGIECIQITEHMSFTLGNAVKYIWRADMKDNAIEDLEKAQWYIAREIAKRKKGFV